ncbi:hypothetical protein [Roseobacter denitrificans]|uniref:hypothetical protein n=1 Tax=Roseobacter denitrificans TaxID=2434 RepID=UPI001160B6A9|nr:hypothetical protein [Roseobacter denitrificans]
MVGQLGAGSSNGDLVVALPIAPMPAGEDESTFLPFFAMLEQDSQRGRCLHAQGPDLWREEAHCRG